MRKTFISLILFFICFNVQALDSITVYDMDGGRVLYGFNNEKPSLIASTTKIMTSIITLENAALDNEFTVSLEDVDTYGSSIYLKEGQKISVESLLYGLLLRSGNDAALTLANNIYGYDTFVSLMNKRAYYLGMKNTKFENPHGLDDDSKNISTTDDMCLLMNYALKNSDFRTISRTRKYEYNNETWYNKNELLGSYKYAVSGKTGYTPDASYTFVSSASRDGKNLIIATFGDKDRFQTHKRYYEQFFDKYKKYELLNKYTFYIDSKYNKNSHLYIKNSYSMLLTDEEKKNTLIDIYLYEEPVMNKSGYISIKINNKEVHREYIYELTYEERKKQVLSILS